MVLLQSAGHTKPILTIIPYSRLTVQGVIILNTLIFKDPHLWMILEFSELIKPLSFLNLDTYKKSVNFLLTIQARGDEEWCA